MKSYEYKLAELYLRLFDREVRRISRGKGTKYNQRTRKSIYALLYNEMRVSV